MPADVIGSGDLYAMTELMSRLHDASPESLAHEMLLGPDHTGQAQTESVLTRLLAIEAVVEYNAAFQLHPDLSELPREKLHLARHLYLKLITNNPPYWVKNLRRGVHACKNFNRDDLQVFRELELTPNEMESKDRNSIEFWSALQTLAWQEYNRQMEAINAEQGRSAELLAMAHEFKRTGHEPTLVAVLDANAGFDILSRRSSTDDRELMIEVKSTRSSAIVVTNGEAKKAEEHRDNYRFYIYDMLENPPRLSIVKAEEMLRHMPQNRGSGVWESVRVPTTHFDA
jgi:hypothetical protein